MLSVLSGASVRSGRIPTAAGGRLAPAGIRSRHNDTAGPVVSRTATASAGPVTPTPAP